jgi:hypothetical protein
MKQLLTMREALNDDALLGTILPGDSWRPWRTVLIAAMGESLTDDERVIFKQLTGRDAEPGERVDEFWGVVGRRGGKTRAISTLAVYSAALCDHSSVISPGERPLVLFLAANQKQAGVAFGYCAGILDTVPLLSQLVVGRTAETLSLSTGVDLEIRAASYRGLRGVTCVQVIGDEAAFWNIDADNVNVDTAILEAVRPTLATTGGQLAVISSPYAQRGALFDTHKQHYGQSGDPKILVVQGASRDFNPSLPQSVVDRAMARDPASANAEYLGLFRSDVEGFLPADAIDACIVPGRYELPPRSEHRYVCHIDPASGVGADAMTMAISYRDQFTGKVVLAAIREAVPPFSPEQICYQFSQVMKSFRVSTCRSDRYSLGWTAERFREHGITLEYSPKSRSDLYREFIPLVLSKQCELLDNKKLRNQLLSLERRISKTGHETIDSPGHEDCANSVSASLFWSAQGGGAPACAIVGVPLNSSRDQDFASSVVVDGNRFARPY